MDCYWKFRNVQTSFVFFPNTRGCFPLIVKYFQISPSSFISGSLDFLDCQHSILFSSLELVKWWCCRCEWFRFRKEQISNHTGYPCHGFVIHQSLLSMQKRGVSSSFSRRTCNLSFNYEVIFRLWFLIRAIDCSETSIQVLEWISKLLQATKKVFTILKSCLH